MRRPFAVLELGAFLYSAFHSMLFFNLCPILSSMPALWRISFALLDATAIHLTYSSRCRHNFRTSLHSFAILKKK